MNVCGRHGGGQRGDGAEAGAHEVAPPFRGNSASSRGTTSEVKNGVAFVIGVLDQPLHRVQKPATTTGWHAHRRDEVVENRGQPGVLDVVAPVVNDDERIAVAGTRVEAGRQVHRRSACRPRASLSNSRSRIVPAGVRAAPPPTRRSGSPRPRTPSCRRTGAGRRAGSADPRSGGCRSCRTPRSCTRTGSRGEPQGEQPPVVATAPEAQVVREADAEVDRAAPRIAGP